MTAPDKPTAQSHPNRRAEDRTFLGKVRRMAWVWPLLSSLIALAACVAAARSITQQTEGRRIASDTTCAALGAVTQAGRDLLDRSVVVVPPRYFENLQRLGAPTLEQRKASAAKAKRAYGQRIASEVERQTGITGLVRKDGTLDCARLRKVSIDRHK